MIRHENLKRILIADDHPIVREGWASIINRQADMEVVAEASSGAEAVMLYRQIRPDLVLMDLRLPGMSGVEAIRTICSEFPGSKCIVLTAYDGDEDIYQALQAGAKAYLLKDACREELLAAVRMVRAGQRYIPPAIGSKLTDRMHRCDLTHRERSVLRLIAAGNSNKQIAWHLGVTEGTIKGHLTNILGKMGVNDRTHAAVTAIRRGLVHLEQALLTTCPVAGHHD
jgi:DNA-binding NarL/FixJ family response regulator